MTNGISDTDIAIVGMAAHLPGAPDVATYWANLVAGVESIRHLSEAELLAAGESAARLRKANYVPAAAMLDNFAHFDADFFGFSPKEAAIMDPQHRQFLEVAWEALEHAAHPPENFKGAIGVYAGCGMGSYFYFNLCSNPDLVADTGMFLLRHTGNDKDFLSTRVSHIFDLRGPSVNVQTACSTSLVAVHYATQALLNGECDMALAGGVTIELPQGRGYLFTEGEILSPNGHCHAFDHRAQGTVFGSGAGCVVLRRLADAIADGDHIWAVIKGSAINNDGAAKAGYLAPSVDGQAACIAEAQAVAGVTADTVGYVECHGTGTYLGDPIEVAALTQAFRETSAAVGTCRIGSVKTNIGHLDTAAGVASLIKTSLALHHRQMPPSLGYECPNPAIDFDTSPFRVNDRWTPWEGALLRAGVNSLGVGGTNAHVVLEQAPVRADSEDSLFPFQPLVISARSRSALDAATGRLADHLRKTDDPLADIAWTLKEGRRAFDKRRVIVAETAAEAAEILQSGDPRRVFSHDWLGDAPEVVFMFPGGGAQYAGMARDLYETEPVFADWMDQGLAILQPKLDYDIRALWLPAKGAEAAANAALKRPGAQLPLIMITEYALAQLFISWGVQPAVLVGHSMGENTAACLAGVISFADCIGLVHLRGQLFDTVPAGGMLSVPLGEADLRPYITGDLDLASVNAPGLCVVSGPDAALDALVATLRAADVDTQRIAIDIAAHSRMLEGILADFERYLRSIRLSAPVVPIISNTTGVALTDAQAMDPAYWVAHLRNTVMFEAGMTTLMERSARVYLEMGPGRALSSLVQANGVPSGQVIAALRHPEQKMADDAWHVLTIARLWACGVPVDWEQVWAGAKRNRVVLPTYPFQRKEYYIASGKALAAPEATLPMRQDDMATWGWRTHWQVRAAECDVDVADLTAAPRETWLMFLDDAGLGAAVADRLRGAGHSVTTVRTGDAFARLKDGYALAPERGREGYDDLIRDLVARGLAPTRIGHFWGVTAGTDHRPGSSFLHRNIEQGFYALMFLAQAMAAENLPTPLHITAFTNGAAQVRSEGLAHPEKAMIAGPVRVIPKELPGVTVSSLDLELPPTRLQTRRRVDVSALVDPVLEELLATPANTVAALRGARRYAQVLRAVALPEGGFDLPQGAVVLITGGFGGLGLTIAEDLIRRNGAKIILIARRTLPDRTTWARHLASHGADDGLSRRILALQRLEALGGQVLVQTADVCNAEEMRSAVAAGEATLGAVSVVIHAAGVVDDGPLLTKSTAQVEEVFAPKLHGTQVLAGLFPDGKLDLLVLFSSTSTVTGPAGQIDYVAANEYLNAYAKGAKGRTKVVALNWGIWTGVGMAAEALADRAGRKAAPAVPIAAPMLDEAGFDAGGNRQFTARYGIDRWVLDGHRTATGQALIPGTGYLEIMAEAMVAQGEAGAFDIRDLYFFRALDVADLAPRDVRVSLARSDEGYGFTLQSAVPHQGRTGWQTHATARLIPVSAPAPMLDIAAITARLPAPELGQGMASPQEAHLRFGPRWRVLNSRSIGAGEGLAHLALPAAFRAADRDWLLHPALLDLATGWAMDLIAGYKPDHLWVPVSYAQVRVYAPLPARITSHVRNAADNRADGTAATFDITLATPDGQVCVDIQGFTIRKLEGALAFAPPTARDLVFDDGPTRAASPAEERLLHSFSQGIRPDEGAEAFRRAVAMGVGQIIVSSLNLPDLVAQTAAVQAERAQGATFERPDLENAYVAPRNDVERTLVGFWQDLLGVGQVGVEDSFFDLGGHSLIAVRLFAMVKKAYRVDFPISVLFEAPTIARCAALITDRIGVQPDAAGAPVAVVPARRFTHLVAMHQGEGGVKTPFFLVAGMFGNVLNLRHLAQLIGGDRPFYGLQARGLYGDDTPHMTFPEAATDYIAEMRQVQPQGPYLLGGFSGGGLIAWDIARQVEAAGDEVRLVALLDTPIPLRPVLTRRDKALIKLAELRAKGPGYLVEWYRARVAWKRAQAEGVAALQEAQFDNAAIEAAFRAALPVYDMQPRQGATVLFRPPLDRHWQVSGGQWVSRAREYVFHDNDLTRFAPSLQVIEVPGDHDSMVLEPNVRTLAARLKAVIALAEVPLAETPLAQPTLRQAAE